MLPAPALQTTFAFAFRTISSRFQLISATDSRPTIPSSLRDGGDVVKIEKRWAET